jgi:hypothetical protein
VYLTDGRLTIDNGAAEQAIWPLWFGRRNWLHLGGDGGLRPTAVLLSVELRLCFDLQQGILVRPFLDQLRMLSQQILAEEFSKDGADRVVKRLVITAGVGANP